MTRSKPQRYRRIANILMRHGLGFFVGVGGLGKFVPFHRGLLGHARRDEPYTRPEHVRMAFEDLGPTFIKFGQILSTRADLLPPEYQAEFAKLQDGAPPVPITAVRATIERELGAPPEQLFASFGETPLATGSLGQAHLATLHDGTEVVVKVRRPGIVEQIEEDLETLAELAGIAVRRWEAAAQYDAVGLIEEFAQTLRAELDYDREAQNAQRFANMFATDRSMRVPRVYRDLSTSRVLTLERMHGLKISDLPALDSAQINRPALARRATGALLKMIFEERFFHADPHPGNFFIEPDGTIALIDFGMVGEVDTRTRDRLGQFLMAVTGRDPDRLVDAFFDLGIGGRGAQRDALRRDLDHLVSRAYDHQLADIRLGPLLGEAQAVARRHRLRLPANLALLLKTLVMAEGLAAQLDPGFQMAEALEPYARELMLRQYSPQTFARALGRAGIEASQLGVELPQRLRRLLGDLERGGVEIGVRPAGLEPMLARLERLANRIVLGIIAAALINGLAVLMSFYHPPGWEQWTLAAFAVGLTLALGLAAYLAFSILWSRRDL